MGDLLWVMGACVVVWIGLFAYLVYVDRRVRELEEKL
jgi:CcmD family protein